MKKINGYKLISRIYSGNSVEVFRGIKLSNNTSVIIKILKDKTLEDKISNLKKEFRIVGNLNFKGIVKIIEPLFDKQIPGIVYEDFGGNTLKEFISSTRLNFREKLRVALNLSEAVSGIHERKILHKNLEPSNIIINPVTLEVGLIDFTKSVAMGENNEFISSGKDCLDINLIYVAPELTGRMNRRTDLRADLYSLGIILYELFSGKPPFFSEDPLEIIHSHLTIKPEPPNIHNSEFNDILSEIILKLLSKNPDHRYQDAKTISIALEECFIKLRESGLPTVEANEPDKKEEPQQYSKILNIKYLSDKISGMFQRKKNKPLFQDQKFTDYIEIHQPKSLVKKDFYPDFYSVLEASQALSGEASLDHLLKKLVKTVLENSGAEKCYLILNDDDELKIAVKAHYQLPVVMDSTIEPLTHNKNVAVNTLLSVASSLEYRLYKNAFNEDPTNDPYIKRNKVKSILCLPMINQRKLVGIIYLENNKSEGAFPIHKVEILKILSTIMAVSIENYSFYAKIEKSEKKYRSLYENAVEGMFQITAKGRLIEVNPAMARIMGYDSPEEIKRSIKSVRHQILVNDEEADYLCLKLINRGEINTAEVELFKKDQTCIWVSLSAKATKDSKGRLKYIEGNIQDITEKKKREAAERKKEAAEAASLAKSNFLANMSHEIRTPMNAIIGFTNLLMQTELTSRQQEHLSKISYASKSLLRIINDILDVSKIEAGQLKIEKTDFNINTITGHLTDIFSLSIWEKGISLDFIMDENLPVYLRGDELRLRQVLINLISNAVKFTQTGGIIVRIEMKEQREDKIIVLFSVQDTGTGIPDEYIPELFSSFSQADTSITRKFGGTGLGLTICNRLVEIMGGKISVESTFGVGTTFSFSVVLGTVSENFDKLKLSEESVKNEPYYQIEEPDALAEKMSELKGQKVLLVEDNILNQILARELLEKAGVIVVTAINGKEGIEIAKESSFSAILMDIQMPEMDGYEASLKIRELENCSNIPIIAMTAHAMVDEKQKCIECGMNDFISKPVDYDNMLKVLHKWIIKSPGNDKTFETTGKKFKQNFESLLERIGKEPVIDFEEALDRIGGNQILLESILKEFIRSYFDAGEKAENFFYNNDTENLLRLAHTLKGVAGNISARRLCITSSELESSIKNNNPDNIEIIVNNLKTQIDDLVDISVNIIEQGNYEPVES